MAALFWLPFVVITCPPFALRKYLVAALALAAISIGGIPFSFWTIVIGHATFCVAIAYNNVVARMRRTSPSLLEASADLGANGVQTFRHVLLPQIRPALIAGGMLAFALSFDEIIVTTFTAGNQQTLPIWIFSSLVRPRQRPMTNVVALFVVALTFIPIVLATLGGVEQVLVHGDGADVVQVGLRHGGTVDLAREHLTEHQLSFRTELSMSRVVPTFAATTRRSPSGAASNVRESTRSR